MLNYLYKKTNHFRNKFSDIERLTNISESLDIVNLGSNQPKYAFDYTSCDDVKGMNWGVGPQSLEYDFAILRKCSRYLHDNSVVLIPICPLKFFLTRHKGIDIHIKYYGFLPKEDIVDYSDKLYITEIKHPIYYHPKRLKFLLKDVGASSDIMRMDCNPMDEIQLRRDADRWIDCWNREFNIDIDNLELSEDNKESIRFNIDLLNKMLAYCIQHKFKPIIMTLPVTEYLGNKFSKEFLDSHVMRYIEQANKDYNCPTLFYLKGNKFKDKDLYFNSFFMNAKGRNLFTHEVVKELRNRRIL